jgi:bacillolysin
MRKFSALAALFLGLGCTYANAQNGNAKKEEKNSDNQTATYVEFNDNGKRSEADAKQVIKDYFKTKGNDDFQTMSKQSDALGHSHTKHQQYYKGIKVESGVYVTHAKAGIIQSMSGDYIPMDENFNAKANLSEQNALNIALASVSAKEYMWDTDDAADYYGKVKGKYGPAGELVIIEDFKANAKNEKIVPHLAYKFDIYATQPLSRANIYVDASSGKILLVNPIIHHVAATGSLATRYSGTLSGATDLVSGKYRLRDYTRGLGIETYNMKKGTSYSRAVDFTDLNNSWTAAEYHNTTKDDAAFDVHIGLQNTYDYWKNVHGRNSWDNANGKMKAYVHYSSNYVNAFWDGSRMTYGDGNGTTFDPLTSQDVTSHELGHAICQTTANLVYSNESGALNEAFSDIWGACIEFAYFPTKKTWYVGDDFDLTNHKGFRNMANPNEFADPDTYQGTYWYAGTADNGGVHTNSGVFNYCFYLLTNGGSGTNDIGSAFNVTAINIINAAKIFYRAESVYMTSSTNYAGARTACIQSAKDLFGIGSTQEIATTNAFYAVGIGAAYPVVTVLSAATNLRVAATDENSYSISWSPVKEATDYDVEIFDGNNWNKITNTNTSKSEIRSFTEDLTWRVVAKNDKGETAPSEPNQLSPEEGIISYKIYPNPTSDFMQIQYKAKQQGEIQVQITNTMGKILFLQNEQIDSGNNDLRLNIRAVPKGRYIVTITDLSNAQQIKSGAKIVVLE